MGDGKTGPAVRLELTPTRRGALCVVIQGEDESKAKDGVQIDLVKARMSGKANRCPSYEGLARMYWVKTREAQAGLADEDKLVKL